MAAIDRPLIRLSLRVLGRAMSALLLACHAAPREGTPCREAKRTACAAVDRALVCESGSWMAVPCLGPRGCSVREEAAECDDTLALEGNPCPEAGRPGYACTPDRGEALVCRAGHFVLWRHCRGAQGCAIDEEGHLQCDTTLGNPGDPCEKQGTYACSADSRAMLRCEGHTFVVASSCQGPDGCRFDRERRRVDCDDGLAAEGDPCERPHRIACAPDRKSELVCDGQKYAKKRDCRRTDCHVEGSDLFCD